MMRNPGELGTFRDLIKEEGLDNLMDTILEVNPEKGKVTRPEEEEEEEKIRGIDGVRETTTAIITE